MSSITLLQGRVGGGIVDRVRTFQSNNCSSNLAYNYFAPKTSGFTERLDCCLTVLSLFVFSTSTLRSTKSISALLLTILNESNAVNKL